MQWPQWGQEEALLSMEGPQAASSPEEWLSVRSHQSWWRVGTRNCGAGRSRSEVVAGVQVKEAKAERCAIFPAAVDGEERAEVVEVKPGGEEMQWWRRCGESSSGPPGLGDLCNSIALPGHLLLPATGSAPTPQAAACWMTLFKPTVSSISWFWGNKDLQSW